MRVFNVKKIEEAFGDLREHYLDINQRLRIKRDFFSEEVGANILKAYALVNELLNEEIDLFNPAGMYSMLELNHLVLCGDDVAKRLEYHQHINETRRRFQENIKEILLWYNKAKGVDDPYDLAIEFYIRSLSQPQLFFEGNHRTENIIFNYVLAGYGVAPFIVSSKNAFEYFEVSAQIKHSKRDGLSSLFSFRQAKKQIKNILVKYADDDFFTR